jgi:hypothetical protein
MKMALALALIACTLATPAMARIDQTSEIKSTRVVTMPQDKLVDCLTLTWGAALITTKQGENTTRLGFESVGRTFSVLLLTPVENGIRVDRQGNKIGENVLKKCVDQTVA